MLSYREDLKPLARQLRTNMTDAEQKLWFHLRRKQISNVAFFRQRPIGEYIIDFYAPSQKLVIEVDGSHHFDAEISAKDATRTAYLQSLGFHVMRFDNRQVLTETESVLDMIHRYIDDRKSLPASLLQREESRS